MTDAWVVVALGLFLGMRHAIDPDHVIAVTTIVARQREARAAALTGLLWGVGHSLTVSAVGTAIILFNLTIPDRIGLGMELSVAAMLVLLGLLNIAAFLNFRPSIWRRMAARSSQVHAHAHSHGDYVHTHPHGHGPDVHPHAIDRTPVAWLDRHFGRWRIYRPARPLAIGVVHGLAGSAIVALLVLAAVREPGWAAAYLVVFGVGTIVGMMLVTVRIASALKMASGESAVITRRLGFAAGLASIVFGLGFAYQLWSAAGS